MSDVDVPTVIEERDRPYDEEAVQVFLKQSPERLVHWWNTWDFDKPLIERDSLVEAMKRSGLYPSEPMRGVYPDVLDPAFADRLLEKKEFSDLRSIPSEEDLCNAKGEFDTTAVQRFISRFMNPSTPYTSALLYHGVGVGKTCSAITVAESFLSVLPDKRVFILAPPAIADNFYRTIFDVRKLEPLGKKDREIYKRRWNSPQCTGLTYLAMSDMLFEKDKSKIEKEVYKLIKKRYVIMGYWEFANYVRKQILGRVPKHIEGEERTRLENEELYNTFSDHLLIVDEAHNLRNESRKGGDNLDSSATEDAAAGKLVRVILEQILPIADGMRFLMMTATPMYDTAAEIIGLLNLMILNDTKDPSMLLKRELFFKKKGKETTFLPDQEATIIKIAGRYVSYMRGENPYSFPIRLQPCNMFGTKIDSEYPSIPLSKDTTAIKMEDSLKNILKALPLVVTMFDPDTTAGRVLQTMIERYHKGTENIEGEEDGEEVVNKRVFSNLISACNIIYPDESFGNDGWAHYFTSEDFGEQPRLRRFQWDLVRNPETTVDTVFGPTVFHQYAPKLSNIINSLQLCKGIGFVYTRFISGGILPLAIAMERAGWTRVLANGREESLLREAPPLPHGRQCALCKHHEVSHTEDHPFSPARFVLLTGNDKDTPDVGAAVKYATTFPSDDPTAPYGSRVKAILGSAVAGEGIDLKCIREIHVMDPWWHLNRIEQIVGRGVRFCSHAQLPMEKRTCTINLHIAKLPTDYETPDLYAYRKGASKSIQIGHIQRAIKTAAFDCNVHHDVLFIKPGTTRTIEDSHGHTIKNYSLADKQYSSICDYTESCIYTCAASVSSTAIGSDMTTYKLNDMMRYLEAQFHKLKVYFQSKTVLYIPLTVVKELFFKDVPWELVALGLRQKINQTSYIVEQYDGTRGTLQLQNGYLVFKPLTITDPEIPIALRHGYAYGRLATHMISPLLSSKTKAITSIETTGGTEIRVTKSLEEKALTRLREWSTELHALSEPTHAFDLKRPSPEGIKEDMYRLLQWMPYRFRKFLYIEKIMMQFYMDRVWTVEERQAVLIGITERRGRSTTTPLDEVILSYISNPDIFETPDGIYGCTCITRKGEELRYCKVGSNPVGIAPPSLLSLIEPVLEPPLNGIDGCSPLYGFHVFFKTGSMFKILNTEILATKNKVFTGSNCTITSNLKRMLQDISRLYKYQTDHPNILLDPLILFERTTKEKADPYTYINQLKSPELCMYTEILLRAFQAAESTSMRWILSMVDAKRAVETRIVKGKTVQKKIFENSFSFLS